MSRMFSLAGVRRHARKLSKRSPPHFEKRLSLEQLEDRTVLSSYSPMEGVVLTSIGEGTHDRALDACLQGDKIVVAGDSVAANAAGKFAVLRYTAEGIPDSTFGSGGAVTTSVGVGSSYAAAAAADRSGKIVAGGFAGSSVKGVVQTDFGLARYRDNGSLDTQFNRKGTVLTNLGGTDRLYDLGLQSDGKVIAAGSTNASKVYHFAVARYTSAGQLDTTAFGNRGIATTSFGGRYDEAFAIQILGDDRILAAGTVVNSDGSSDFALACFAADGKMLDPNFGTGGKVITDLGQSDKIYAVAVDGSDIIVAGNTIAQGQVNSGDLAVARYNSSGQLLWSATTPSQYGLTARSIAIQADHKIVVAGYEGAGSAFAVARYNPDGTRDVQFNGDGLVITAVTPGYGSEARSVLVQGDKIIAAGYAYDGSNYPIALVRYNSDGSLDATFGRSAATVAGAAVSAAAMDSAPAALAGTRSGIVTTVLGTSNASLASSFDGEKVVVAGFVRYSTTDRRFSLLRYEPDGRLDPTFGSGGVVTTKFNQGQSSASAVTYSAGKIIAAGEAESSSRGSYQRDFALARYNSNGAIDTTFGGVKPNARGTVQTDLGNKRDDYIRGVVPLSDGKILVAGNGSDGFIFARYTAAGKLDTTFNGTGAVKVSASAIGLAGLWLDAVALQGATLVAAGRGIDSAGAQLLVVTRYDLNGRLDTTFGEGGWVTKSFGNYCGGHSIAIDGSGAIYVGGYVGVSTESGDSYSRLSVAKFSSNGELDLAFNAAGPFPGVALGYFDPANLAVDQAWSANTVAIQADGKVIAGGRGHDGATGNHESLSVCRFNANGTNDGSFGAEGTGTVVTPILETAEANSILVRPDGRILAVGYTYTTGMSRACAALVQLNPDGSLDTSFGDLPAGASGDSAAAALAANSLPSDSPGIASPDMPTNGLRLMEPKPQTTDSVPVATASAGASVEAWRARPSARYAATDRWFSRLSDDGFGRELEFDEVGKSFLAFN